jgi:Co/Zn/Cd efflux system component
MIKTTFHITQMDCASEEQLIRMKLEGHAAVHHLAFNITERRLIIFHEGSPEEIATSIHELNLGSTLIESREVDDVEGGQDPGVQRKLLWSVLAINFGCFLLEMIMGLISRSMGLVADSLDMLADALVYGLALLAVGGTASRKRNIARAAGYFQFALAIIGLAEVVRRFLGLDTPPLFTNMIIVSLIALTGNAITLWLLQKSKSNEPHMKASMIFTSNDVIINLGVILAGGLVYLTGSNKPDLIVGAIVFFIVTRGALRILRLGK